MSEMEFARLHDFPRLSIFVQARGKSIIPITGKERNRPHLCSTMSSFEARNYEGMIVNEIINEANWTANNTCRETIEQLDEQYKISSRLRRVE